MQTTDNEEEKTKEAEETGETDVSTVVVTVGDESPDRISKLEKKLKDLERRMKRKDILLKRVMKLHGMNSKHPQQQDPYQTQIVQIKTLTPEEVKVRLDNFIWL